MAISRESAFGVFEDLLAEGLRPVLTGFRSDDDKVSSYWPKGSEGFFVYAHFSSAKKLGSLVSDFARMEEIASRHDLVAWFAGHETEYDEQNYDGTHHEFRVSFGYRNGSYTGERGYREHASS